MNSVQMKPWKIPLFVIVLIVLVIILVAMTFWIANLLINQM